MKTDIEIAQGTELLPVARIAEAVGLPEENVSLYGRYKAKVDHRLVARSEQPDGRRAKPPLAWAWRMRCTGWAGG